MSVQSICRTALSASLCALALAAAAPAAADGEIGEHVKDLSGHVDEYTREVHWLIDNVAGLVDGYAAGGSAAVEPAKVVDWWEDVIFHDAIETNFVPVYASIWQGLFGVRMAIEGGKPVAEVRAEEVKLQAALWQALGAVRLAAQYQQQGTLAATPTSDPTSPTATVDEIKQRLDRVVAKYAERLGAEAKSIVFDTYQTRFEGLEGDLITQDADLVEDLEVDFNVTLPQALDGKASVDRVREIVSAMQGKLDQARALLADVEQRRKSVF